MNYKIAMLIWICAQSISAAAQGISDFNNMYMNAEVGKIKGYRQFIQGGAYVQFDRHYFKIKSSVASVGLTAEQKQRFDQFHSNCECEQETKEIQDIAFMYGRSYRILKHHQVQVGAGLSIFMKNDPDEEYNLTAAPYELEKYNKRVTVGLPAELRYSFQFKRYLALSCTWNFNANFLKSYNAVSFGASLGLF